MREEDQPIEPGMPAKRAQDFFEVIRPGGRFAGQVSGNHDSWASLPGRTHHSQDEVVQLLEGFEIEMMRTEERDDEPDVRNPKHWHLFHVVAEKH